MANRPVFLLAELGAMTPSAASADVLLPPGTDRHPAPAGSLALLLAAAMLIVVALLVANDRIGWRLGAIAIVACGVFFGGDAIAFGAQTAVAVSL